MLWNANGISQVRNELEIFLHQQAINIEVITEMHLSRTNSFIVHGYMVYSTHHPDSTAHGSAMVLV